MGMADYVMLHELGKGAFGTAHAVRHKADGQIYVLKRVRLARQNAKERQASLEELHILSGLAHRNIMGYKESWVDAGCIVCMVVELCEGGDLLTQLRLRAPSGAHFSEEHLREMLVQLSCALSYLHRSCVVHRDFKSANILITSNGCLKLADFGLSCILNSSEEDDPMRRTVVGTPSYMCPELLEERPYGRMADIWALGCVMYELSALRPAYQAFNMSGLKKKITTAQPAPLPASLSDEWRAIVKALLNKEAGGRPTADEVLQLPWLQDTVQRVRDRYGLDVPEGADDVAQIKDLPEEMARLESHFRQMGVDAKEKAELAKAAQEAARGRYSPRAVRVKASSADGTPVVPISTPSATTKHLAAPALAASVPRMLARMASGTSAATSPSTSATTLTKLPRRASESSAAMTAKPTVPRAPRLSAAVAAAAPPECDRRVPPKLTRTTSASPLAARGMAASPALPARTASGPELGWVEKLPSHATGTCTATEVPGPATRRPPGLPVTASGRMPGAGQPLLTAAPPGIASRAVKTTGSGSSAQPLSLAACVRDELPSTSLAGAAGDQNHLGQPAKNAAMTGMAASTNALSL